MGMLIAPSRFGSDVIDPTGFLDGLSPAPRCCLSLRRLCSTAIYAIRIRRSTDNAELDIGFAGTAVNSAIDLAAITAFVGSGSAYITTFYDQSGNGFHQLQPTAANQTRIVNAGTYDAKQVFNGSSSWAQVATLTQGASQFAIYSKLSQAKTGTKIIWEGSGNYNNSPKAFVFYTDAGGFSIGMNNTGINSQRRNDYSFNLPAMTQMSVLYDRSLSGVDEIKVYVAGTLQTPAAGGTNEQTGLFDTAFTVFFGARAGTSLFADPGLETWVAYNADTAAIRTSIEAFVA